MREIVGVTILIFAISVFAQTPQPSQTPGLMPGTAGQTVPLNNQVVPMNNQATPMTNTTTNTTQVPLRRRLPQLVAPGAPTAESTMGPAGRPDLDLAPTTAGSLNALPPNVASGDANPYDPYNRHRRRSTNTVPQDSNIPPNTTTPLPPPSNPNY